MATKTVTMGKIALVKIQGATGSPFSPSRNHETPKIPKESHDAYDERTWREHAFFTPGEHVYIPSAAFRFALIDGAKHLGENVPGKKGQTWTGYFTRCIGIPDNLVLAVTKSQLEPVRIWANADGKRGSGKRVWRRYPLIPQWEGDLRIIVYDDTITEVIFQRVLQYTGMFIGVGRYRPQNGGENGRFTFSKISWTKLSQPGE